MAEGQRLGRRHARRIVTDAMGFLAHTRRDLAVEVAWSGRETDFLRLPVDVSALSPIQDQTTGAFHFMVGVSSFDGPEPWA